MIMFGITFRTIQSAITTVNPFGGCGLSPPIQGPMIRRMIMKAKKYAVSVETRFSIGKDNWSHIRSLHGG